MSKDKQKEIMKNRRELVFLYDVTRSNPNGDPDDGNRPRMDEDGYNIVTDVRLKRTIRDHWISQNDPDRSVLIKQQYMSDDKTVMSMRDIVKKELDLGDDPKRKDVLERLPKTFLDVRTFGAAVTLPGANVSITGPVQFGIGVSLNKPEIMSLTITTVMSSTGEQGAGSMGQTHVVDYSLIAFHGIACETNSEILGFTESDLRALFDGMWNGTKNLNTRSKFNHQPHLILSVVSKDKQFQIGSLDAKLSLEKMDGVKKSADIVVIVDDLLDELIKHKEEILKIEYKESLELAYSCEGKVHDSISSLLKDSGIALEEIS